MLERADGRVARMKPKLLLSLCAFIPKLSCLNHADRFKYKVSFQLLEWLYTNALTKTWRSLTLAPVALFQVNTVPLSPSKICKCP